MSEMAPYLTGKDEKDSGELDGDSSEVDDWDFPLCFDQPRHLEPIKGMERVEHSWRVKEKYKTHCVALVLCLNVGVDPPDVVKTQPAARLQCWIDPQSLSPSKALESIGHALQAQYERWQPRARYKQSLDPTSDEVKKLCCSLRRNAKDERVLFHYNGHGVPRPTAQGEIWVFNRAYTQYIPLSMYDLQTWMGAPSLYVYDCSNAGVIVDNFKQFAEQHERDYEMACAKGGECGAPVSYRNCIQLAACAAGQSLPMNPELPADLFTACLTTPVKMAMKWFVLRNRTRVAQPNLHDLIDKIPGQVTDRRTMLGELNWIFTAITDTIAWSALPAELFQQLFRADLLTASLCRNFLLAERVLRSYNCTPVSQPALPPLHAHPLWAAWEHALDLALAQLPALAARAADYAHSPFFRDQLSAFELWLALGAGPARAPPQQLPVVLQVLLSTLHRVRALQILCRFLALGAWAVRAVLHVGIFPYMLKLLQASAPDLRPTMVYIWAKIVAVDPSCQADLLNAKGHRYFLQVLQDPTVDAEHRALAAYVLAGIVDGFPAAQEAALQGSMISACLEQLADGCAPLRRWAAIALGRLWRGFDAARWAGVRDLAHEKLLPLLRAPAPEERAAAAFALGAFMAAGAGPARSEHANALDQQVAAALAARAPLDASPLVRVELLCALQWPVLLFEQHFVAAHLRERLRRCDAATDPLAPRARPRLPAVGFGSVYVRLWDTLTALAREPQPAVARAAAALVQHVAAHADAGREVSGSWSLPPSPVSRAEAARGEVRRAARLPHTISEESVRVTDVVAAPHQPVSNKPAAASAMPVRAIVSSSFVEWAWAGVARAEPPPAADVESRAHHERAWRRLRNTRLHRDARALAASGPLRLESVAFHARTALPGTAVALHPYEQALCVCSKDAWAAWNWGTGARTASAAWRRAWGRVTALQWVDAHAGGVLCACSAAGHAALLALQPEPRLLAAWRALPNRPHAARPPAAHAVYAMPTLGGGSGGGGGEPSGGGGSGGGVVAAYAPRQRSLLVAGAAPLLRIWDLHTELLLRDIPTDSEAAVTAVWRGGAAGAGAAGGGEEHMLAAGLSDGGARLWDERAGGGALAALQAHGAPLLLAARRPERRLWLTVCAAGEIRVHDTRALAAPLHTARAPPPLAAADLHPLAPLLACGSVNQCVAMFDLQGNALNTIKFHEGFMGARIGPVACLAFHPLRCALAVATKDSAVSVYVAESRR